MPGPKSNQASQDTESLTDSGQRFPTNSRRRRSPTPQKKPVADAVPISTMIVKLVSLWVPGSGVLCPGIQSSSHCSFGRTLQVVPLGVSCANGVFSEFLEAY